MKQILLTILLLISFPLLAIAQETGPMPNMMRLPTGHPNISKSQPKTTEQVPDWYVSMRHVIVSRVPEGLLVTEMLAVNNPADLAWVGTLNSSGQRATLSVSLPTAVEKLEVEDGFPEGQATFTPGLLVSNAPMLPGTIHYRFNYILPIQNNQAQLSITAPAPVRNLMVFLPDDGTSVTPSGLQPGGTMTMHKTPMRFFKSSSLQSGQTVSLNLNLAPIPAIAPKPPATSNTPQIIAGIGVGILLLVGVIILLVKSPTADKKKRAA